MHDLHRQNPSLWLADGPATLYPQLNQTVRADVVVIGGGITGLLTALQMQRNGASVAVIEARRICSGTTGYTTAKVTSQHGLHYSRLESGLGADQARLYGQANQAGLEHIASLVDELAIDCQFQRQPALVYTHQEKMIQKIREETEAACRAGLPASFTTQTELPFEILGAVRFENQAQLDPYKFCTALAREISQRGGQIFEQSRAVDVQTGEGTCQVITGSGTVQASHVVLATLLPFLDRGGFFAKAFPQRAYGISVLLDGPAPGGMHLSAERPTRSVRSAGPNRIVVVGENHKVGHHDNSPTEKHFTALEAWATASFPVRAIEHRWSAQDFMPAVGVPYIGRQSGDDERLLVATGFQKWGLTTAAAAAMMLSDLVQRRDNPWLELFDARRADVLQSAKTFIVENLDVAKRYVGDRLKSLAAPALDKLAPGSGGIVDHQGDKVAAYRDENGVVHAVSPICTHMGCYLSWNSAEKSWDCPCHGSRFDCQGTIIDGPAVEPLQRKSV